MENNLLENYFQSNPFDWNQAKKEGILFKDLLELTEHHKHNCLEYDKILNAIGYQKNISKNIVDIPMLPVRLFKHYGLKSILEKDVIKTLTSSGTTSQIVSKIFLDKETAKLQTKALVNIMSSFIGKKRLPMLIIDTKDILKNRKSFSARGAGIMGMMNFGRDHTYLLDEKMDIDFKVVDEFLKKYEGEKILMFGFTFMVWEYLFEKMKNEKKSYDFSNAILIHSGGWKKLIDKAVDNDTFKSSINNLCGINKIHNFYGMVEQVGSIYVECEKGVLHSPSYADIILRNPKTWKAINKFEKKGVIETVSVLPRSYPGHAILTEDEGEILGIDDCSCGRKGKYFKIIGRLPKAEVRGCSDTHEE
jgi:hypothetical protein